MSNSFTKLKTALEEVTKYVENCGDDVKYRNAFTAMVYLLCVFKYIGNAPVDVVSFGHWILISFDALNDNYEIAVINEGKDEVNTSSSRCRMKEVTLSSLNSLMEDILNSKLIYK